MPLKELNAKIARLQFLVQDYSIETMPQWVSFTTTTFCNLKCPHCQTHGTEEVRRIYNRKNWSGETLGRVAKESLPKAYEFCLTLNGEPLCTPQFTNRLDELSQYGARLHLTTNGTLFSEKMLSKVLPLVGTISISIDGGTELTCEAIRLGVKFRKLLTNIRLLTKTCELVSEIINPDIRLAFTIMGSNIRDMPEIIRLAHVLKVPAVDFYPVVVFYPHLRNEDMGLHKALYNTYYKRTQEKAKCLNIKITLPAPFPEAVENTSSHILEIDMIIKRLPEDYYETLPDPESFLDYDVIEMKAAEIATSIRQRTLNINKSAGNILIEEEFRQMQDLFKKLLERYKPDLKRIADEGEEKTKYCENLSKRIFIGSDGDLTPCCIQKRPVLGNINRNTVKEIWNGDMYNDFRQAFYSANPPDCCKDCRYVDYISKKGIAFELHYPKGYKWGKWLMKKIFQR